MTSFAQQLRSRLFGGVLGGSSKATAAAGVDLSRKTKKNQTDGMSREYGFIVITWMGINC